MKNNKKAILILILLLTIGFAAVSTSLVINGTSLFGVNLEDFDVIFTKAVLDNVDVSSKTISTDGKSITFETNELKTIGDISVLDYEITNNSKQYDASVSVECTFLDEKDNALDYVKFNHSADNYSLKAKSTSAGRVQIELLKQYAGDDAKEIKFKCVFIANALEKTEMSDSEIAEPNYNLTGVLVDENGEVLANKTIVVYSIPKIYTTDELGNINIKDLEEGDHELYYLGEISLEEINDMTKEEIQQNAISKTSFTTTSTEIILDNNMEIQNAEIKESISDNLGEVVTTTMPRKKVSIEEYNALLAEKEKLEEELANSLKIVNLGAGTSFNVSSYEGYENFTVDNFIVGMTKTSSVSATYEYSSESGSTHTHGYNIGSMGFTKSYDATTGVFTIKRTGGAVTPTYKGSTKQLSATYQTYLLLN